jgi:formate--tetrahydrofolate ligase
VCVNKFSTDSDEELELVVNKVSEYGARGVISEHWEKGGQGAIELAKTVILESEKPQNFKLVF